ncbi:MAG TPA: diacylglycerol kinase [Flavobacteriales bacterium]|nr:diacylglycerol kinase [Flavobacteriales bacterium]|tara:strand:- start:20632 stop:21513 length:882 start_codon:yes stop_codon:yes gene_type:complete
MTKRIKIAFIINPVSGVGKQKKVEVAVEKLLDKSKFDASFIYSQYPGFITDFINDNSGNYSGFVAVGGDGTINEAVQALVNKDLFLCIIPTGSGNGLARHLKIPMKIEKAVKRINEGKVNKIDVLKVADYYSVNVAGCGFDAEIGWDFATLKKRGLTAYIRLISEKIWKYSPIKYHIKTGNDTNLQGDAFIISFANGTQYGNNAVVSPLSDLTDGIFELIIVKPFSKRYYPAVIAKLFTKNLHQSKFVQTIQTKRALVKINTGKIHIDGEPRSIAENEFFNVEILPKALKVLF